MKTPVFYAQMNVGITHAQCASRGHIKKGPLTTMR